MSAIQFAQLLAAIRVVHDHILQAAARRTAMDELVLQHQRGRTDDLTLARVLHNGHIVVAALLHLREAACAQTGHHITRQYTIHRRIYASGETHSERPPD